MSDLNTTQPTESTTMTDLQLTLTAVNGIPTTTSLDVARHFGKQHKDVLRAIRQLLDQMANGGVPNFEETPTELSEGYGRNFALIQIEVDLGMGRFRKDPAYRLTKDGFTLLAMGFTGAEALKFKLAYIAAFNAMEAELLTSSRVSTTEFPKQDGQQFLSHRADIFVAADRSFRAAMRSGRSAGLKMPQALRQANQIALEKTGVDMLAELRAEDHVADLETRQAHGKHDRPNQSGAFYRAAPLSAACFWGDWHSGLLGMPYQSCLSEQIYRAYTHWCKLTGEHYPLQHVQFSQSLISHCQNKGIRIEVRVVRLEASLAKPMPTSARMLLVSQPPSEALGAWATELAVQFEKHLAVYLAKGRVTDTNTATAI